MQVGKTILLSLLVFYGVTQINVQAQTTVPPANTVQPQNTLKPCDTDENKAFDFWLGEWKVTTPDPKRPGASTHAGNNTVEKIQDGCVVRESWRSATSPYSGTSYNFFNKVAGRWEQIWLDNQGGGLHLRGNKIGKQMILSSDERPDNEGKPVIDRITWTENDEGSVRQYWEVISKEKPAVVLFDGLYQRSN